MELNDPGRCQVNRRKGPCMKRALKGSKYCAFHNGKEAGKVGRQNLPRFYSKHLSGTLKQAVARAMARSEDKTFSLREELALVRVTAGDAVSLYSAACETGKQETMAAAAAIMRDALQEVVKTCEAAARVESMARDKIPAVNLHLAIQQVVKVVYKVLGDDNTELAERINRAVQENILIEDMTPGTLLTPDQDVLEMDATVP